MNERRRVSEKRAERDVASLIPRLAPHGLGGAGSAIRMLAKDAECFGIALGELGHLGGERVETGQDEEPQALECAQGDLAALDHKGDLDETAFEGRHAGRFGGGRPQPAGGGRESFAGFPVGTTRG